MELEMPCVLGKRSKASTLTAISRSLGLLKVDFIFLCSPETLETMETRLQEKTCQFHPRVLVSLSGDIQNAHIT